MRRVNITGGNLTLMDYCTAGPQYASGGFIADSQTGFIINGSQQQFLVRDSSIGGWSNGVWNQVFSGVVGAPPQSFSTTPYDPPPYTTLATSPVTRERPFLYVDSSGTTTSSCRRCAVTPRGTTWAQRAGGRLLDPDRRSSSSPSRPTRCEGDQQRPRPRPEPDLHARACTTSTGRIKVKRADTVVLGLGFPTLVPDNGVMAMTVADVKGVKLAGLMFDAGPVNSPVLLQVGTAGNAAQERPARPDHRSRTYSSASAGPPRARPRPAWS